MKTILNYRIRVNTGCAVLLLALLSPGAHCQQKIEKRLTGLEVRVVKVEKRVTRLESGKTAPRASDKIPPKPITATFIKKENIMGGNRVGVKLFVELENVTNRRFESFSGKIVFMDGNGQLIYAKKYSREEVFEGGERITLAVAVTDSRMKTYLKLLKVKVITADFTEQKFN
ncbi:MAG: hypothetical protein NTX59_07180 [Elusimicrobia bacterium]|nr:hypothetical protein [Elusimicrobiota bacterium]